MIYILPYGCKTWPLTLRKKRSLRIFENRILRQIFGPKRDWEWGRLHKEELDNLLWSSVISNKIIRMNRQLNIHFNV